MRYKYKLIGLFVLLAIGLVSSVNPCRSQSSPPATKNGPCPGCNLPPGLTEGSELPAYNPEYMGMKAICGDDAVSRIICQPSAQYTYDKAKTMCKAYRDGLLHDLKVNVGVGTSPVNVEVTDLQEYCDRYFPVQWITTRIKA